jgi:hypothetical protein
LKCESKKAPDIGGLLAVLVMDFRYGPPMQFLSGVDKSPLASASQLPNSALAKLHANVFGGHR